MFILKKFCTMSPKQHKFKAVDMNEVVVCGERIERPNKPYQPRVMVRINIL